MGVERRKSTSGRKTGRKSGGKTAKSSNTDSGAEGEKAVATTPVLAVDESQKKRDIIEQDRRRHFRPNPVSQPYNKNTERKRERERGIPAYKSTRVQEYKIKETKGVERREQRKWCYTASIHLLSILVCSTSSKENSNEQTHKQTHKRTHKRTNVGRKGQKTSESIWSQGWLDIFQRRKAAKSRHLFFSGA